MLSRSPRCARPFQNNVLLLKLFDAGSLLHHVLRCCVTLGTLHFCHLWARISSQCIDLVSQGQHPARSASTGDAFKSVCCGALGCAVRGLCRAPLCLRRVQVHAVLANKLCNAFDTPVRIVQGRGIARTKHLTHNGLKTAYCQLCLLGVGVGVVHCVMCVWKRGKGGSNAGTSDPRC